MNRPISIIMFAYHQFLKLAGMLVVCSAAGIRIHPRASSNHREHASRSGIGKSGGLNGGEIGGRFVNLQVCLLPAQLSSAGHTSKCICPKGSVCKGMLCTAKGTWDPEKVN